MFNVRGETDARTLNATLERLQKDYDQLRTKLASAHASIRQIKADTALAQKEIHHKSELLRRLFREAAVCATAAEEIQILQTSKQHAEELKQLALIEENTRKYTDSAKQSEDAFSSECDNLVQQLEEFRAAADLNDPMAAKIQLEADIKAESERLALMKDKVASFLLVNQQKKETLNEAKAKVQQLKSRAAAIEHDNEGLRKTCETERRSLAAAKKKVSGLKLKEKKAVNVVSNGWKKSAGIKSGLSASASSRGTFPSYMIAKTAQPKPRQQKTRLKPTVLNQQSPNQPPSWSPLADTTSEMDLQADFDEDEFNALSAIAEEEFVFSSPLARASR